LQGRIFFVPAYSTTRSCIWIKRQTKTFMYYNKK